MKVFAGVFSVDERDRADMCGPGRKSASSVRQISLGPITLALLEAQKRRQAEQRLLIDPRW